MEHNVEREEFLQELQIPSNELWIGKRLWNQELNQQIMDWISQHFIPKASYPLLARCREQIASLWKSFQEWLWRQNDGLDLRVIDSNLLLKFETTLPVLGWSPSAIHLIEGLLIHLREFFHEVCFLPLSFPLQQKWFSKKIPFSIKTSDYRTILNYFMEQGNDFEIVYFDLATMAPRIKEKTPLHGADVLFKEDRAFIAREFSGRQFYLPCAKPISERLLRLLRSRNILAGERIFRGQDGRALIHYKKFKKMVETVCLKSNIPLFATESLFGFQLDFLRRLERKGIYKPKQLLELAFPTKGSFISEKSLDLLDEIYNRLVEDREEYDPPYTPHDAFDPIFNHFMTPLTNIFPQNDTLNEHFATSK